MLRKILEITLVFTVLSSWFLSGWPQIWQIPKFPPEIREINALNKLSNWNFADASIWAGTNDNGTNVCGDNNSSTGDTAYSTFAYNSGTWRAITAASKNSNYRGKIAQTVAALGTGTVKAKGKITYTSSGSSWSAANTSWIRLDLYDSSDAVFVANLICVSFNSNQSATSSFSSDVDLTGGTTYTVRVTMRNRVGSSNAAITTTVDDIVLNFAPIGLSASAQAGTTNALLSWTTSTAATGANGLHATTPYKVYRDTSSPVSTFLANATTNSYTDSSTTGNTTYYYAITDVDTASDESPKSAEFNILTLPGSPGTPTFTSVAETTLTVNWTAPTGGATSYKIERCSGSGCSNFSEIRTGETGISYDDSSLNGATLYRYRIRATNATGDGAYSEIGEVTTAAAVSISLTTDGAVSFGTVALNTTVDNSGALETISVDSGPANLNIKTTVFSEGGNNWTLGAASNGPTQILWEFSKDGTNWTIFTAADPTTFTFDTNVAQSATRNLYLRLTMPTTTNSYNQYSSTITVVASTP